MKEPEIATIELSKKQHDNLNQVVDAATEGEISESEIERSKAYTKMGSRRSI